MDIQPTLPANQMQNTGIVQQAPADSVKRLMNSSNSFIAKMTTPSNKFIASLKNPKIAPVGSVPNTQPNVVDSVTPTKTNPQVDSRRDIVKAIAYNESRGEKNPYSARRFSGKKELGDALGAYQVTQGELKSYGKKYTGKDITDKEFIGNKELQDLYMENKVKDLETRYKMSYADILRAHRGGLNVKKGKHESYVRAGLSAIKNNSFE